MRTAYYPTDRTDRPIGTAEFPTDGRSVRRSEIRRYYYYELVVLLHAGWLAILGPEINDVCLEYCAYSVHVNVHRGAGAAAAARAPAGRAARSER